MKVNQIGDDTEGGALAEFAIALPLFTSLILGLIWLGLLMWTQFSLQRSVALAARCATTAQSSSASTTNCDNQSVAAPPTKTGIQNFAATQYFGLPTPTFTATLKTPCGSNTGNLVSATYTFRLLSLYFFKSSPTLTAQSCYPMPNPNG
jgi:Flp pilus assembly protein TadG